MAVSRLRACLVALLVMGVMGISGAVAATEAKKAETGVDVEAVKAEIWQKELAIFAGRGRGDTSYYLENASPDFLAWTSGTKTPFDIETLAESGRRFAGKDKEIAVLTQTGFSLSGDTAISYFKNHRTRTPDGAIVDQTYDNIHVWRKTEGVWNVLASFSRLAEF